MSISFMGMKAASVTLKPLFAQHQRFDFTDIPLFGIGNVWVVPRDAGGEQHVKLYCTVGDAINDSEDWLVANRSQTWSDMST